MTSALPPTRRLTARLLTASRPLRRSVAQWAGVAPQPGPDGAAQHPDPMAGQRLWSEQWVPKEAQARLVNPALRRLLLLHMPKTGGSSLRRMYAAHVPEGRTFLSTGKHEWVDRSRAQLRNTVLFTGHQFLEPLYWFPEDDWVTVLPVREPLSWWRSWYKFRRQQLTQVGNTRNPIVRRSLGEWVDGLADVELSNPQASYLVTRIRIGPESALLPRGRMIALGESLTDRPREVVKVLERLLERVTVLGVTEDLQSIYERTCAVMGWEPQFTQARRDNVSHEPPELLALDAAQEARLRRVNGLDTWLYEQATRGV